MFGLGIVAIIIGIVLFIWWSWCRKASREKRENSWDSYDGPGKFGRTVICVIAFIALAGGVAMTCLGVMSEGFKRWTKDLESEYDGGLERRITIVDKDGEILKEYEGKMDIQSTDGNKLVFVMDGKKYIIYNNSILNTVFVEEIGGQA